MAQRDLAAVASPVVSIENLSRAEVDGAPERTMLYLGDDKKDNGRIVAAAGPRLREKIRTQEL